ncbi:MAG: winged helix-turn-helix transcriptional regulator [Phycisphaerales bacterium JB040]
MKSHAHHDANTDCPPDAQADPSTGYELSEAFHRVTDVLKCKWTLAVLRCLEHGHTRPSEMQRQLPGLTSKVLTDRLKRLEDDGFVDRTAYPEIPPRVEYTLTERGRELTGILDDLIRFIERW